MFNCTFFSLDLISFMLITDIVVSFINILIYNIVGRGREYWLLHGSNNMRSESKIWLESAKTEFRLSISLKDAECYNLSFFHAHQSIEKILKVYLLESKSEMTNSHNLCYLGKVSGLKKEILRVMKKFIPGNIDSRSIMNGEQSSFMMCTRTDVENFIDAAEIIIKWVEDNLEIIKTKKIKVTHITPVLRPDGHILRKLRNMKIELKKRISLKKLYLLGSRARGDFKLSSNVDILIISNDFNDKSNFERTSKIYDIFNFGSGKVLNDILLDKNILCMTPEEFDEKVKMTSFSEVMVSAIRI